MRMLLCVFRKSLTKTAHFILILSADISECSVTRDLKYCKVSVSVYDTDEQARKDTIVTLNNAAGHIGWELGKRMQIRAIPKFKFVLDEGIAYSVHIADILSKLDLHGENQSDDQ